MTCILSVPVFCQNQYSGDNITAIKYVDLNWMVNGCQQFLDEENRINRSKNQVDSDKGSTRMCLFEHSIRVPGNVTYDVKNVFQQTKNETKQLKKILSDKHDIINGNEQSYGESYMCMIPDTRISASELTKIGVKRRASICDYDGVYVPSKRVSPFLNTPKERKDERKNVLKICIRKIKDLNDPEVFLRRSVLVNNLTKRLQTELRQDKQSSRKFSSYKGKFFNDCKVLNNSCWSDTYLFDDPFLISTHQEITDDMTDTLIRNVLCDNK